jgi:glycosyltransferase involved in cell wall biosynthesis
MKCCIAIAEIVQELLARHPNVYFAFIGKNEMFNGRAMIDLIKEKAGNFVERIIYSSPIRHDSLFPIIENAVAVVLPSRIDNIPNTCVEAMAVGQIVVGTNGASFDELIRDGESGYLCYPDDSKSLLQSIENVFALSPERRMRMAEKAKEKISEMEPQKTITRLIGLYREILKKKGVKIDLPKKRNIPQDS